MRFDFDHIENNAVVVFLMDLTIVFSFSLRFFFLVKFVLHAIIQLRSPIIDVLKITSLIVYLGLLVYLEPK